MCFRVCTSRFVMDITCSFWVYFFFLECKCFFLFIRVTFGCIISKAVSLDLLVIMNVLQHCILKCCWLNWVYKALKCVHACLHGGDTGKHTWRLSFRVDTMLSTQLSLAVLHFRGSWTTIETRVVAWDICHTGLCVCITTKLNVIIRVKQI